MSITNLLTGIGSLAGSLVGSGAAAVKFLRDDKDSRYPPEYLMYKDMLKQFSKYPCMTGFNPMMNFGQMMNMNPLTGFNFMNQNQFVQQQLLLQQLQNAMAQQAIIQQPVVTVPPQGTVQFNNIQSLVQEIVQQVLQRQQQQQCEMRRQPVSLPTSFIQPPPLMLPMNSDPPMQIPVITIPRTTVVQPVNNTPQVIVNGRAPVPIEPVQAVSMPGGEELSWNNNRNAYSIEPSSIPSNYIGNVL